MSEKDRIDKMDGRLAALMFGREQRCTARYL